MLTKKHEFEGFDLGYSHEAMARAYAALKDKKNARIYFEQAQAVVNKIADEEDRKILEGDLKAGPWYGMDI